MVRLESVFSLGFVAMLVLAGFSGACNLAYTSNVSAARSTRVGIAGGKWTINGSVTYPGAPAEGLLLNVRMVNAVFEDRNNPSFDPEGNADEFIAMIPDYVAHGVRAFTLNLQGGNPGLYSDRKNPGLTVLNSAFNPDGSLKTSYMNRVARVIEACDQNGAVVILGLFYFGQDQYLQNETAIRTGVVNAVNWIRANDFTNVLLEIANEYPMSDVYDHPVLYTHSGQGSLLQLAKQTYGGLLISTSSWYSAFSPAVAAASDYLLVHEDEVPSDFAAQMGYFRSFGKPVVINEDGRVGPAGAQAAEASVLNGASWGMMHYAINQTYPFTFNGVADDPTVYAKLSALATPASGGEKGK
jgi:hypothetical protein